MTRRRRHPSLVPLSHDHRDALALAFFADHLTAHFRAEEEALFGFLRLRFADSPERLALIDQLVADHRELGNRRDAVAAADGDVLVPALVAFADLLEAHVRREERELFEHFPDGVPAAEAQALADSVRRLLGR